MLFMKFLVLLLLMIPCFAQSDLPDRGQIADLKGKSKVFIVADGEHFDAIKKVAGDRFEVVGRSANADFFIAYKTLSRDEVGKTEMFVEHGQLDVYYLDASRKVIA